MAVRNVEERSMQRIISEYSAEGYDVIISPTKEQLPDFLSAYRLDALARRGGESVVIEVRSRPELARSDEMSRLAEVIREHPGWTLELILMSSDYLTNEDLAKSLEEKDIARVTEEAEALLETNLQAALLLSWSAVEAALRLLALKEDITVEKRGPNYLLERLTTEGILSREDYRSLADTLRLRNEVAHGFKADLSQAQIRRPLELIQHLLEEVGT